MTKNSQALTQAPEGLEFAMFAGGCFWCMVGPFESEEGVLEIVSGYSGGDKPHPTYREVSTGTSGHREVVHILYDPSKVSYSALLEIYWRQIDPTDDGGQFADRGDHYKTAIYYYGENQKNAALESKSSLESSARFQNPIVTEVLPAKEFYPAEEEHQDYHKKNPIHYKLYSEGSGRAPFIRKKWAEE